MSEIRLPTPFQEFIHLSRYARWNEEKGRRETWQETVDRYVNHMCDKQCPGKIPPEVREEIRSGILNLEVMPSMRCLMTAGEALEKTAIAAYNCCFVAIDDPKVFDEILLILMCGTGVGISVERQFICHLPVIAEKFRRSNTVISVEDSREGWANAFRELISMLYAGCIPSWDTSKVRPAGARLKTFGGRASGPAPLVDLFQFCVDIFKEAAGRKLNSIECHDIACKIGEIVVVGGVRRSALISLSNPSDDRMRYAKSGEWWKTNPHRALANNSACHTEKPGMDVFMREWQALYDSKSGERGIFNREAAKKNCVKYGRRDPNYDFGSNPCLVGDTLVSVADGRTHLPIRQLAEEGRDVPVYCRDNGGKIVIRMMRNPRRTRQNAEIIRVTFDDDSYLRVTANHQFLLRDGRYVPASELVKGDSLELLTRYRSSLKWLVNKDGRFSDYWWMRHGNINQSEHRIIAAAMLERSLRGNEVVHHRDNDGLNNCWANLEVMPKEKHDTLHQARMLGDNNPMRRAASEWSKEKWAEFRKKHSESSIGANNGNFSGVSDENIRQHAVELTRKLGRRYTNKEWIEYAKDNGLPQRFSNWRVSTLGDVLSLAKWAALQCGIEHVNENVVIVKSLRCALEQGYDAEIIDGRVMVSKKCEKCDTRFVVSWSKRGMSFCSLSCSAKQRARLSAGAMAESLRRTYAKKKERIRESQLGIFTALRCSLGRTPLKNEWVMECRKQSVSPEISRVTSPFRYWSDLEESAVGFNHRVVSVEPDGTEDVYCGSVDEFHNFFVGGFQSKTKDDKEKFFYVNNLNCNEVILRSASFCNLTEVIARPGDAEETLKRKVRLATIMGTMQATITNFTYLRKIWRQNTEEEALLGVSITGVLDNVLLSGAEGKKKLGETLGRLREYAVSVNKEWAAKLGINQATAVSCVKPSGCATLDTKIKTGGGIKSFAEIFAMNMVNPIGLRDGMWIQPTTETIVYDENNLPAKVTKFYINGMAEVYEIEDDKGNVYKFTGNHRLKTTNGWRRVDKLTEDDEIIEFI